MSSCRAVDPCLASPGRMGVVVVLSVVVDREEVKGRAADAEDRDGRWQWCYRCRISRPFGSDPGCGSGDPLPGKQRSPPGDPRLQAPRMPLLLLRRGSGRAERVGER